MNNIDMLEEMLKNTKTNRRGNKEIKFEVNSNYYTAILNLIAENKELKEKNKKIKQEYINPNKARISYFDHKKRTNVVIEGFIPKSKVEETIQTMNTNILNAEKFDCDYIGQCRFAKYVLQSLLGKE